jgi:hypothetical protein
LGEKIDPPAGKREDQFGLLPIVFPHIRTYCTVYHIFSVHLGNLLINRIIIAMFLETSDLRLRVLKLVRQSLKNLNLQF